LSAYYHAVGLASLITAVTPGANAGAVVQFGADVSIWTIGDLAVLCVDGAVALMMFCTCEG
jgi:L-arabinose isomerase